MFTSVNISFITSPTSRIYYIFLKKTQLETWQTVSKCSVRLVQVLLLIREMYLSFHTQQHLTRLDLVFLKTKQTRRADPWSKWTGLTHIPPSAALKPQESLGDSDGYQYGKATHVTESYLYLLLNAQNYAGYKVCYYIYLLSSPYTVYRYAPEPLRTQKLIFGKGRQNPQFTLQYHIHQGRGKSSSLLSNYRTAGSTLHPPVCNRALLPQLHYKEISELQYTASKWLKTTGLFFLSQKPGHRPWADLSFHPRTASMLFQ